MMIDFWFFAIIFVVLFLLGKAVWQDSKSFKLWKWKIAFTINNWKAQTGYRRNYKIKQLWEKMPELKILYILTAVIVFIPLVVLFFALYFQVILIPFGLSNLEDNEIRNLAFAFLGTVTGLGGLFGVYLAILRAKENTNQNEIAKSQANTAEQGMITDRINKAVEGLGKRDGKDPVIEVRLGALYALERIAKDSERDHIQILEILCAYIRTNSHQNSQSSGGLKVREDIQAAITIIGRREKMA